MRRISFAFVLLGLVGCYASEKMGKDIHDTSHDVNQGGIYMHKGALGVYRPEPQAPELTSATMRRAPAGKADTQPPKAETTPGVLKSSTKIGTVSIVGIPAKIG